MHRNNAAPTAAIWLIPAALSNASSHQETPAPSSPLCGCTADLPTRFIVNPLMILTPRTAHGRKNKTKLRARELSMTPRGHKNKTIILPRPRTAPTDGLTPPGIDVALKIGTDTLFIIGALGLGGGGGGGALVIFF